MLLSSSSLTQILTSKSGTRSFLPANDKCSYRLVAERHLNNDGDTSHRMPSTSGKCFHSPTQSVRQLW